MYVPPCPEYDSYEAVSRAAAVSMIENSEFKSSPAFRAITENVNADQGAQYLKLIEKEFPSITHQDLMRFGDINDNTGDPDPSLFATAGGRYVTCAPTSLRYLYHALRIVTDFATTGCLDIAEIGAGYGGLFLAINFATKKLAVPVRTYAIVELPGVGELAAAYIELNRASVHIPYTIHAAADYGADVSKESLYVISNYCFTEISETHRVGYSSALLKPAAHGFMAWQTVFGTPLGRAQFFVGKTVRFIEEERPQTATQQSPNFFVFF
jgi:hypothetical protein